MFNPYGFQGGTATLDPQSQGTNGQTRIAEALNGQWPVAGVAPVTGIPVGQPGYVPSNYPGFGVPSFGQPTFANVPFGANTTPFSGFANPQTPYGIPQSFGTPGYHPFPCPTTSFNFSTPYNYGTPFSCGTPVNYSMPFGCPTMPFVNNAPVQPWAQPGINGQWPTPFAGFNPFATVNPYAMQNPFATVNPYASINPFTGVALPTPFGGFAPMHPFFHAGINPFGGIPTIHPITGQPIVNQPFSPIVNGVNTPASILNNPMAQSACGANPMAWTPFMNPQYGIHNAWGQPTVNPWQNPFITGYNPINQVAPPPFFSSPVTPTGYANPLAASPFAVNPLAANLHGVQPFVPGPMGVSPFSNPLFGNPFAASALGGQHGCLPSGAGIDPITYNYLCNLAGCTNPSSCGLPFGFGGMTTPFGSLNPILASRMGLGWNPWSSIPTTNPLGINSFNPFIGSNPTWFGSIQNPWIGGMNNPWSTAPNLWNNPISSLWNNPLVNPSAFCGTIPGATTPFNGTPGFGSFAIPSAFANLTSCWPANCN